MAAASPTTQLGSSLNREELVRLAKLEVSVPEDQVGLLDRTFLVPMF